MEDEEMIRKLFAQAINLQLEATKLYAESLKGKVAPQDMSLYEASKSVRELANLLSAAATRLSQLTGTRV